MNRRNFLCKFVGAIVAASEICRLELPKEIEIPKWKEATIDFENKDDFWVQYTNQEGQKITRSVPFALHSWYKFDV